MFSRLLHLSMPEHGQCKSPYSEFIRIVLVNLQDRLLENGAWTDPYGHTMSPGDEPTQNARVERTIGILKNQVRTLIKASVANITWWPLALRHASERMLRSQLWEMGIATPQLPAFGSKAVARSKTWHQRTSPWKFPGCQVRIWGPACDMSITSGGVYVQDTEGRWMRTTVVRPVMDPAVDEDGKVIPNSESTTGGVQRTSISEVPKNRCGGSSPVTPEVVDTGTPPVDEQLQPGDVKLFDDSELDQPSGDCWEVEPLVETITFGLEHMVMHPINGFAIDSMANKLVRWKWRLQHFMFFVLGGRSWMKMKRFLNGLLG